MKPVNIEMGQTKDEEKNFDQKTIKITQFKIDTAEKKKNPKLDKFLTFVSIPLKILGLLSCLYFFVVSLNLMSSSFPLIAGKYASEAFRSNVVLTNPIASIMIGLLATVIVQSSSTSTSIVVSMVASGVLPVRYAIPIIMGTNVGTSITSTIVALSHAGDKEKFRRSFAGATVHDMFNLLTVAVLLPVEMAFGYLEGITGLLVRPIKHGNPNAKEPEMLNAITKPLTDAIVQIDKSVLDAIATNSTGNDNVSLLKRKCKRESSTYQQDLDGLPRLIVNETFAQTNQSSSNDSSDYVKCDFLFANVDWPEWLIGLVLLIVSLVLLSTCLVCMVKILSSVFNGPVAKIIQKVVNSDLPGVFKYLTGFLAILLGCILTIIVQSSSVFTSTLTPLVGMGLVSLERVFPLTLGSNIGTTITGILASLSGPSKTLKYSLQIALCHTLFNITGILIWYPIPYLRNVPLNLARGLGNITAEYRWFAIVYLVGLFFLIPLVTFGLSLLGRWVVFLVVGIIIMVGVIVFAISKIQKRYPDHLPMVLRDWTFLPIGLRSLKPYDDLIIKYLFCLGCCKKLATSRSELESQTDNVNSKSTNQLTYYDNETYQIDRF